MNAFDFNLILGLITSERIRDSSQGSRGILIDSESDKARVINSSAFRRLQQKAQVFPLEPNAAVRTRLTHSIEVSQIGRYIAQKIIKESNADEHGYEKLTAFVNTIETSCLLHDIGNPPFGHLGEAAVKEWFKGGSLPKSPADLMEFDGNPQGFRIISFLNGTDKSGLNLTCTLMLSTIKYPWTDGNKPKDARKIGIFTSDYETYETACRHVRWDAGKKFPFVYIMDAADDIAYSLSDIEDGLEKKIITEDYLRESFGKEWFPEPDNIIAPVIKFKTKVTNEAANLAAKNFTRNINEIIAGNASSLIDESSDVGNILKNISQIAREKIYTNESAEKIELAGRSVIKGLLKNFEPLLSLEDNDFSKILENDHNHIKNKNLDFHARLLRRLPKAYIKKYKEGNNDEFYRRCHLIVDFIGGMTDDFALNIYQILEGIKIK